VRLIAAEAGVSTGFVMHYFPEKQHLLDAVLEYNNVRAGARATAARRRRRGLEAVTALIEALLPIDAERRLEWQVWSAFWTHVAPDGAAGPSLEFARVIATDMLGACLQEAIDDGDLPEGLDVHYEAERLVIVAAGLGLFSGAATSAAAGTRMAKRMVNDHIASLRGTHAPT
jgi:AcrR family transcriptional regulator